MEFSMFIAKMISVVYLSLGVGLLVNKKYYHKSFNKAFDESLFTLFAGVLTIVLGGLIVQNHNFWVADWTLLVTIIGWLALVKGSLLLAFPKSFSFFKPFFKSKKIEKFITPLVFLVGIIFGYFGFFG